MNTNFILIHEDGEQELVTSFERYLSQVPSEIIANGEYVYCIEKSFKNVSLGLKISDLCIETETMRVVRQEDDTWIEEGECGPERIYNTYMMSDGDGLMVINNADIVDRPKVLTTRYVICMPELLLVFHKRMAEDVEINDIISKFYHHPFVLWMDSYSVIGKTINTNTNRVILECTRGGKFSYDREEWLSVIQLKKLGG